MFVPSNPVYAELHDQFDDMIQRAFRSKVVIVSPSLLMLAIQVIQQIHRDAKMREAADKIHAEVGNLMDDLPRLRDRVNKLDNHFGQANEDIRQILHFQPTRWKSAAPASARWNSTAISTTMPAPW